MRLWLSTKSIITSLIAIAILGFGLVQSASADSIYTRYFESYDIILREQSFQIFAVSALQGEKLTIATYGLSDSLIPSITVFDPAGRTITEDLNNNDERIAAVQWTATIDGMYTFAISRKTEASGLVRVMMFEGDPIDYDVTLLDFAAPNLPSRAFLIDGNSTDPIGVYTEITQNLGVVSEDVRYFVSRGSSFEIPPEEERFAAIENTSWINDQDTFYTLNIRAIPEQQDFSYKNDFLSPRPQFNNPFEYIIQIGEGSEEFVRIDRPQCQIDAVNLTLYDGPDTTYDIDNIIVGNTTIEIVGRDETGEWLQIVNENEDDGNSWIPSLPYQADSDDCSRVTGVYYPPTPNGNPNSTPNDSDGSDNNNGSDNDNDSDDDNGNEEDNSDDDTVDSPPPPPAPIPPPYPICASPADNIVYVMGAAEQNYPGQICNETITGNSLNNTISGDAGNDTLNGGDGDDTINGGAGNDTLNGGNDDDTFIESQNDDTIDGGAGTNTYVIASPTGSTVDLFNGTASSSLGTDGLANIDNVEGSSSSDTIIGSSTANVINGNGGDDVINGDSGDDTLNDGTGNDTLNGDSGNDTINTTGGTDQVDGGDNNDTINISGVHAGSTITGGTGNDTFRFLSGASGTISLISNGVDTLDFSNYNSPVTIDLRNPAAQNVGGGLFITLVNIFENVVGSNGDDNIHGNDNANNITGGNGNDVIYGGGGSDTIDGEGGSDILYGGSNNEFGGASNDPGNDTVNDTGNSDGDVLYGGNNNANGGSGDDTGNDTVYDNGGNNDTLYGGNKNFASGNGDDTGTDNITHDGGDFNTIYGGNFNEQGGEGDDDDDIITVGTGNQNTVYGDNDNHNNAEGQGGSDTITVTNNTNSTIYGGNQNWNNNTTSSNDSGDNITVSGSSNTIYGGNDNAFDSDAVTDGDDGADIIQFTGNNNTVYGGNNNSGGDGTDAGDTITDNGSVDDTIYGGNDDTGGGSGGDGDDTINVAGNNDNDDVWTGNQGSAEADTDVAPACASADIGDTCTLGNN